MEGVTGKGIHEVEELWQGRVSNTGTRFPSFLPFLFTTVILPFRPSVDGDLGEDEKGPLGKNTGHSRM